MYQYIEFQTTITRKEQMAKSKEYLYKGKKYSQGQLSKMKNVHVTTMKKWIDKYGVEGAMSHKKCSQTTHKYKDKEYTISELAKMCGVSYTAMHERIKLYGVNHAVNIELKKYLYRGQYMTLPEIANKTGVGRKILYARINMGWDIEKAVNTPIRKKTTSNSNFDKYSLDKMLENMMNRPSIYD